MRLWKKYTCFVLLAFLLLLAVARLSLTAYGAENDIGYEQLTEVYSVEEAKFLQQFSEGYFFKTSIPNNQITRGHVRVEFPPELEWSLKCNGAPLEYASGESLTQQGSYVFTVRTPGGTYSEFSFTIAAANAGSGVLEQAKNVVLIHNYADGRFYYTFENGKSFSVNVPNGGITNYGVTIQTDSGLICALTKNGSAMQYESGSVLTEDGYYHMRILSPTSVEVPALSAFTDDSSNAASIDLEALEKEAQAYGLREEAPGAFVAGEVYQTILSFQIITQPTRDIFMFNVPPGFAFKSVYLNGRPIKASGMKTHRIHQDGDYAITLEDTVSSAPEQTVQFTVKTSPPAVWLDGVEKHGSSAGPVTVHGEDGVTLSVYRNNMETVPTGVYKERGRYLVMARDAAGNTAQLSFEIKFSLSRSLILTMVLVLLVAAVVYVVWARRSMQV